MGSPINSPNPNPIDSPNVNPIDSPNPDPIDSPNTDPIDRVMHGLCVRAGAHPDKIPACMLPCAETFWCACCHMPSRVRDGIHTALDEPGSVCWCICCKLIPSSALHTTSLALLALF